MTHPTRMYTTDGWVDLGVTGQSSVPLVTALPSSPTPGQEVYYQNATMATAGIVWHLRYNGSSSSAYKWEYIGGPPVYSRDDTNVTTAGTAWASVNVGNYLLPLSGDYYFRFAAACVINSGVASAQGSVRPVCGAITGIDVYSFGNVGLGNYQVISGEQIMAALVAGSQTNLQQMCGTAGSSITSNRRWISLTPIRVG